MSLLFSKVTLCAEVEGQRQTAVANYNFVGLGYILDNPICSFWIVKHGVLATAKHCFTHLGMDQEAANNKLISKISIKFLKGKEGEFSIESSQLNKIIFDSGINDLAIITYSKVATESLVNLPEINLMVNEVEEVSNIAMLGYPDREHRLVLDKKQAKTNQLIMSSACQITGESSVIMPTINNPGYDGSLFDTTCAAWFFVGGGPVFKINENG